MRYRQLCRHAASCLAAALLGQAGAAGAFAGASVTVASGVVQVRRAAGGGWLAARPPEPLEPGDKVKTGGSASARIAFDDGSAVELGPDANFTLDEAGETGASLRLDLGGLRAWIAKLLTRRFEVRTPTAVCSVRGTEFGVQVLAGGRTFVELYQGLLGVEDLRGNARLLKPNERLMVDVRGLGAPEPRPTPAQSRSADFREAARAEVGLDLGQEQLQAAVARESRLAEFQQGKALLDVSGARVRLEEYVLRPRPDQFKLVVLNQRQGRTDYFYYLGTFNRDLPGDLSTALRELPGCAGAQCSWYLTEFQSGRSNMSDSVLERGQNTLGGQVDVNGNLDGADNVTALFDPAADSYVDVTGRSVFQTLFNRYGFYVNGRLKYGWTGAGITSYADVAGASTADPFTGAALTNASAWLDPATGQLATRSVNVTFPTAGRVHQRIYESYSDGSYLQWDNYVIGNDGRVAGMADFSGITAGAAYRRRMLDFNYEQVLTSSHFGSRRIDLVVEPKILVQAGLVP